MVYKNNPHISYVEFHPLKQSLNNQIGAPFLHCSSQWLSQIGHIDIRHVRQVHVGHMQIAQIGHPQGGYTGQTR